MAKRFEDLTKEEKQAAFRRWMETKPPREETKCTRCEGTGKVTCPDCDGSGTLYV